MREFLPLLVIGGGFAAILGGLAWLAVRLRRRGGAGGIMGPFEEIWHPAAHRIRVEVQAQEERAEPAPGAAPRQWPTVRLSMRPPG
jgi:hypothetical protein